ncbi:sulfotransferase family protein [Terricaulis sp.]|uniref:sulfotransferase family protein n=1 Tax=Terricaulis sp. TaxID=2768686 RepID=UPI003783EDBC
MRPHCWGIGLGRTGTTSFCEALKILGYEQVAHNPRFERLRDLQGGADNGVTIFYKYLDYKFPGSRFVLTLRPLEPWLKSMEYIAEREPVLSRDEDIKIQRRMALYETVSFDRGKFIAAYERHHADVRRYFADRPQDLLEMNLVDGDGWEVLCPFLNLPTPEAPFPHLHARQA